MELTGKERLAAVLATYGADPARWPEAERRELSAHLAAAGEALAEAQAMDRLLAAMPEVGPRDGFALRLMARIDREVAAPAPREGRARLLWGAALPLAASLLLGAYLGAAGELDPVLPDAVTGAAIDGDDGGDPAGIAGVTDYSPEALG